MKGKLLLSILLATVLIIGTMAYLQEVKVIPSKGYVKTIGVEVYWDQEATELVTEIDWGILEPAENKTTLLYIRNEQNTNVTLSLNTTNWNPIEARDYITLSWNYTIQMLEPTEIMPVALILSVSESIKDVDSFSFDIIITAIEVV